MTGCNGIVCTIQSVPYIQSQTHIILKPTSVPFRLYQTVSNRNKLNIKVRMINFDFDQNQIFKPKIHTKMNPHENCIVKKCFGTVMVEQSRWK